MDNIYRPPFEMGTTVARVFNDEQLGRLDVIVIDNQPWFIGKQIATLLGYVNTKKAIIDHVNDADKKLLTYEEIQRYQIVTFASPRGLMLINRFGVNDLVLRSKLPAAERLRYVITHEVMPAIQDHGIYMTPEAIEKAILNPDFIIGLATRLKEQMHKTALLQAKVDAMAPKSAYCDAILKAPELVNVTAIAKDYGVSATFFNRLLHELGIQYRCGKLWVLYQQYADLGYTQSQTYSVNGHAYQYTCWTQKGRFFLYETLKAAGYLPTIELQGASGED